MARRVERIRDYGRRSNLRLFGSLWPEQRPTGELVIIPETTPAHSMIRVIDEAKSVDFYGRAFGLELVGRFAFADFVLVYLRHPSSSFELELTVNFGRTKPYELGDGYGHLAFVVEDLDAVHETFCRERWQPLPIKQLTHDQQVLARFFFVSDPDGYKIEVIQKGGRFA